MSDPLVDPHRPRPSPTRLRAALSAVMGGFAVILVGVIAAAIVFFLVVQLGIVW